MRSYINHDKALVVFSGGQDSTTCLFWAKKHFKEVYALSFQYGQKHAHEVDLARRIAEKAGVPFECMDATYISKLSHNALTDSTEVMDEENPRSDLPTRLCPAVIFFLLVWLLYMLIPKAFIIW